MKEPMDNNKKKSEKECKREECNVSIKDSVDDSLNDSGSCLRLGIYTGVFLCIVFLALWLGRDYLTQILKGVEGLNPWLSAAIFLVLYVVVAFPMTWGYILLNIAAGYLFGNLVGLALVFTCATTAITVGHFTMKKSCLRSFAKSRINRFPSMRATLNVVDGDAGAKVVFLSRLTPIPFGLQNALYAFSNIAYLQYILASAVGMLPYQGMHVYLGSTFKSMEEVLASGGTTTPATYVIFGSQILIMVVLFAYVMYRARLELNREVGLVDVVVMDSKKEDDVVLAMEKGRNGWVRVSQTKTTRTNVD